MTNNIVAFPATKFSQQDRAELRRWVDAAKAFGVVNAVVDWCAHDGGDTGYEYLSITDAHDDTIALVFRHRGDRGFRVTMPGEPGQELRETGPFPAFSDALNAVLPALMRVA